MASNTMEKLIAAGGLLYVFVEGPKKALPAPIQSIYDQVAGALGIGGGTTPGAGTTGECTAAGIAKWASDIKLSTEVGKRFCADNGHLPHTTTELNAWGDAKGYRNPTTTNWSI